VAVGGGRRRILGAEDLERAERDRIPHHVGAMLELGATVVAKRVRQERKPGRAWLYPPYWLP